MVNYNNKVIREVLTNETELNSNKMKMIHINEVWQLPEIRGKENQVKRARGVRYTYLKEIDKSLSGLTDEEKEVKIKEAIDLLEFNKEAKNW